MGLNATTPVGLFVQGVSPYGLLDMSGNVWEWTRSLWGGYPYPESGKELAERENLQASKDILRVLRGGAFDLVRDSLRCAYRSRDVPRDSFNDLRFRVVVVVSSRAP